MSKKEFNLFSEGELSDLFKAEKKVLSNELIRESAMQSTKSDDKKTIEHYFNEHKFEPINIDFDHQKREQYIDKYSRYFKHKKRVIFNGGKRLFILYKFPFAGDSALLHYTPVGGVRNWSEKVFIENDFIGFEKVTYAHSTEDYQEEIDEVIRIIKNEVMLINNQVLNYNDSLKDYIKEIISAKEKLS